MYNSFLIKYGEIGIKGDNRHLFEDALAKRIRTLLARIDEFLTFLEIIRKASQGLICACNNVNKRHVASSVTKSSGKPDKRILLCLAISIKIADGIIHG